MTGTTPATLGEQALRRLGIAVVPVADRPPLTVTVPVADLATRALIALSVIASDEAALPSDLALATQKVQAVHDAMALQAFIPWDINSVPQGVSEEYVLLCALHLASSFGKQGDPAQQPVLEARVRKVAMVAQAPAEAERAIMSVHQDLAMRGMVRWTVFDIPPAVEGAYIYMAANDLAPTFGAAPNPADDVWAERAIHRYIALPTSGERVPAEYF
jgi:hypothetical protein